jgi:DNA-binding response OmpR family regulator
MVTRVLLADPDKELLDIFHSALSGLEFEIATAETGPEGADLLRQFEPDVLVMELDLADQWSNRLLVMMKSGSELPPVPTIILSRFDDRQDFDDWPLVKRVHVKPISIATLKESICLAR